MSLCLLNKQKPQSCHVSSLQQLSFQAGTMDQVGAAAGSRIHPEPGREGLMGSKIGEPPPGDSAPLAEVPSHVLLPHQVSQRTTAALDSYVVPLHLLNLNKNCTVLKEYEFASCLSSLSGPSM